MDSGQSQEERERAEEASIEGASTSSFVSPLLADVRSGQYDVFLSFRGSDTRKEFTDHLYHRLITAGTIPVSVFRDDNSIPIGEEFDSQIFDAITQSKISIPIISENYASSKWCLRELIHMMDCRKSTSHKVLPIFYKVNPSDVRNLKGSFGSAFHSCSKRFDEKDIQEGQRALREVGELHGWESEKIANGHEGELVERVVKNTLSKLQQDFQLDVPEHLVGIGDHVNKIMNWVDAPTNAARMIGIYGMGGIGKTTLARVIYNQVLDDFVHHSFLADIRETAHSHGIPHLQKQIIRDVLQIEHQAGNVDDGINLIKSRFKGKKVLILLDDIDDNSQLDALARERNWFMPGSMIIVTTRNEAILDQSKFEVDYKYELNELDGEHALHLFNRHAFRKDHSPRDFEDISHDIISTMSGLPLALEVVGSYLYKKTNRKVWEDIRKQLKNQPHKDVQKILKISYDGLEVRHKQIFLDIVCFFIGEDSEFAMYMWEARGLYPSQGIEELKLRSLIKIGDDGKFKMHDQLRDLGRSIFCEGQPLEKCSGPWDNDYKGVPQVLRQRERLTRFDDLMRVASSGDSTNKLLSEVRWLQWWVEGSDLSLSTINLHLPKLSVLELYHSDMTEDWQGWNAFMVAKQLKVLNLYGCPNLRCAPDLSAFTQLKILILTYCYQLERLHPSIGKLTSLVSLKLKGCTYLKELPQEVGGLKDLEELKLDFAGITEIPTFIGSLRKLKKLSANHCESFGEIPRSMGDLQTPNVQVCNSLKGSIPSEIGDLSSLEILNIACTPIFELPESIRNLSSLQRLDLWGCDKLRSLPELPSGLKYLWVSCQSPTLPQLSSLVHLEELRLWTCHLLEHIAELPSRLSKLYVEHCDKLILLKLDGCKYLEELSIKKCSSIERLDLPQLIRLKRLRIVNCNSLIEIQGHDNLESLEGIFLYECNSIERLLCPELRCLNKLDAIRCNNLVEIQGLDGAKCLEALDFRGCKSMEILPNLTGCEKLGSLNVRDCKKLTQLRGLEKLDLIDLDISGCNSLEAMSKLFGTRVIRNYERHLF